MSGSDSSPRSCFLVAGTGPATAALGAPEVEITTFPFRVGRESRSPSISLRGIVLERRIQKGRSSNDLYLLEPGEVLHVSRTHFQIEREGGEYALVDRGSTCGTLVDGVPIGGDTRGGRIGLAGGETIIVGKASSPFVFRFKIR